MAIEQQQHTIRERVATELHHATERLEHLDGGDLADIALATSAVCDLAEALAHLGTTTVTVTPAIAGDQAAELAHDLEQLADWVDRYGAPIGMPLTSSRLWSHVMSLRDGRLTA